MYIYISGQKIFEYQIFSEIIFFYFWQKYHFCFYKTNCFCLKFVIWLCFSTSQDVLDSGSSIFVVITRSVNSIETLWVSILLNVWYLKYHSLRYWNCFCLCLLVVYLLKCLLQFFWIFFSYWKDIVRSAQYYIKYLKVNMTPSVCFYSQCARDTPTSCWRHCRTQWKHNTFGKK